MSKETILQLCDAIVELFSPLAEVVIHDLDKNGIYYIKGELSNRAIGDPSFLDLAQIKNQHWANQRYSKHHIDGRLVKSISIPYPENKMICLNCDVSIFQSMRTLAEKFLENPQHQNQADKLFKNDWQEKVHVAIHQYLTEQHWQLSQLNSQQKKQLLHHLYQLGVFEQKKSVDYLAKQLSMGRATIFNYLKAWRQDEII